jgi:hypothetical protein
MSGDVQAIVAERGGYWIATQKVEQLVQNRAELFHLKATLKKAEAVAFLTFFCLFMCVGAWHGGSLISKVTIASLRQAPAPPKECRKAIIVSAHLFLFSLLVVPIYRLTHFGVRHYSKLCTQATNFEERARKNDAFLQQISKI